MTGRLRGSITGRMGLVLAAQAAITAGLTAAALRWLASPALGLALALLVCVPALAWLAGRAARPWRETVAAVCGAIGSLRERDFSVNIAAPRVEELRSLVEAYNGLGEVLRRERFDLYQRELLLDTVLQTTPHALILSNDGGRIVYGNIAARAAAWRTQTRGPGAPGAAGEAAAGAAGRRRGNRRHALHARRRPRQ